MNGLATAASIVVAHSSAAALLVYANTCSCPWGMNVCWIAAIAILFMPCARAMRWTPKDVDRAVTVQIGGARG